MHVIESEAGREALHAATVAVMLYGRSVSPRGLPTRELVPVCIEIRQPWDAFPDGIGRERLSRVVALDADATAALRDDHVPHNAAWPDRDPPPHDDIMRAAYR